MIIVSVDTANNIVRLLSIPRDLWVYVPGHGNNRINTADLWGELAHKGDGPERVKQTIYQNLGIPIHYYVRVDFQGFIKIIDTVGGVDIDVDCPLADIDLTAGIHHMNGQQALRYARSRKSTNDFDRSRRQRKVLLSLWEQGLTLDIIPKLPILWRTMADSFQTDLPLSQVINLAYVGTQLKPQRILSQAIGPSMVEGWITPEGAAVLLPRQDRIKAFLEGFYAPRDLTKLDSTTKVRIRILNGSPRREADQLAAASVHWEGFKATAAGPADRQDYATTRVLVYNGDTAAGTRLAEQLAVPAAAVQDGTAIEQPDPKDPVEIVVILGRDYDPCQR
jgi:LCP family protein required for cell wall assembly